MAKKKPASSRRSSRSDANSDSKVGSGRGPRRNVDWAKLGRRPIERIDDVANLAAQLKQIREDRGETIGKVAGAVGVPPATLIKFEDRAHPVSVKVLTAVAEHLDCDIEIRQRNGRRRK